MYTCVCVCVCFVPFRASLRFLMLFFKLSRGLRLGRYVHRDIRMLGLRVLVLVNCQRDTEWSNISFLEV